ncbi:methylase [Longilinea arvoryzae]|uniref:Methylase n=1 Tax=Longilinea arvoryzae TaxID=360412 RepID=A0A0S7BAJ5_9CHLR|nr:methyltransferase domain-containing protein [Longilinea arvoryzae]GAP14478.1 methylase [Longilinea arvoryzae]
MLTPQTWHRRFSQQARWTEEIRRFVIQQAHLSQAHRVLETGCGTGAVLSSMQHLLPAARFYGIDLRLDYLLAAQEFAPESQFAGADAASLPVGNACFDAVICHYFLLWVKDPPGILAEMKRVTRPGGTVIALAEPDYGGRIDYPMPLAELGRLQGQSLQMQGADPFMGRKLSALFHQAGFTDVHTGLLGGQWNEAPAFEAWESEWAVLQTDLEHTISRERLDALRSLDAAAWQKGERILFVPTFYAWGKV